MIRETIIRKIVKLNRAGCSLLEVNIRTTHEFLHAAAASEFGSWETAIGYAGVTSRQVERNSDLTPKRIKRQLRRLCTTGYDLEAKANRSFDRVFYEACLRHFGSWRGALIAAGVNL